MSLIERTRMEYIAEIGSNWKVSEDMELNWIELENLVNKAAGAGADIIKFQAWNTPKFIHPEHPDYDRFKDFELPSEWYADLIMLCNELKVKFMATAFDKDTADALHELGQKYWKIASGDINHLKLIEHIAKYGQPMYISTGNANMYEIEQAVKTVCKYNSNPLTILHCVSKYPTKLNEVGFNQLKKLVSKYGLTHNIGWSSHVAYPDASIAASMAKALGATVIETHVCGVDSGSPDSSFAMTPTQLELFIGVINLIDMEDPIIDEHELLWARRGDDDLRPWINWEVRDVGYN